jgi:hypothetical protein
VVAHGNCNLSVHPSSTGGNCPSLTQPATISYNPNTYKPAILAPFTPKEDQTI